MTTDTRSATVLVVEDERSLADLYARFAGSRFTTITAYDGSGALDAMSDEVDVVLLDRRLPGLSGEEVLEAIREGGYDCRVAMVTAVTPDVDIVEMGFDDYLTKPVARDDLLETVESLLEIDAYDALVEECYRLASKKAALEDGDSDVAFSDAEELDRLTGRLADLEAELRGKEDTVSEFDFRSLLDRP